MVRMIVGGVVAALLVVGLSVVSGCVHRSGGTWMFDSAPRPEGWPALSPVGEVVVREYPEYRAARVVDTDGKGKGQSPMFMELFGHIKRQDIAMTAPVDMGYAVGGDGDAQLTEMAFLYRTPAQGSTGTDGKVRVEDVAAERWASVGVRGGYTDKNFERGLRVLETWLAEQDAWEAQGGARFLGYNGPFVPWFWRYGEVQVPVRARSGGGEGSGETARR